jgi:hypothetical protein
LLVQVGDRGGPSRGRGALRPGAEGPPAFLADDLAGLRERLALAGFEVVDDEPLVGYNRFYTSDPFGNRIELLSPLHPREGA